MSGSAALSAARKRRASSSQMPGAGAGAGAGAGVTNSTFNPNGYYYGTGPQKPSLQGIMNQSPYGGGGSSQAFTFPKEAPPPNVQINIYENIELIKKQLTERTNLIKTQGSSIPADKLRILQKQNEIQTQILKQKMAIAQQMELVEQQRQEEQRQYIGSQLQLNNQQANNEPEFIYEKGIPRNNPKYRKPEQPGLSLKSTQIQVPNTIENKPFYQAKTPATPATLGTPSIPPTIPEVNNRQLTPFVSMITDTGVIPPPVVILKSHDSKLEEHHYLIQDMLEQLDYLHSTIMNNKNDISNGVGVSKTTPVGTITEETAKEQEQQQPEEEEETELLMDVVMNDLTNSREFVAGIVDKIVNETNLSEVIMKIEPIIKENQELRSLIHSQQQMMNEMNMMLFRLLNQQQSTVTNTHSVTTNNAETETETETKTNIVYHDEVLDCDGLYQSEITTVLLSPSDEQHKEEEYHNDVELQGVHEEASPAQEEEEEASPEQEEEASPSQEEEASPAQEEEASPAQEEDEASPSQEEETSEDIHMEEVENIEQYADDYSEMPQFPEPISLVVSEL